MSAYIGASALSWQHAKEAGVCDVEYCLNSLLLALLPKLLWSIRARPTVLADGQAHEGHASIHDLLSSRACRTGLGMLKRRMSQKHFETAKHVLLQIIVPLLKVLVLMHEQHILHRDIKPENIFLSGKQKLKLGDLGLAIRSTEELPFTRSGTLDYMAPEVDNPTSNHKSKQSGLAAQQRMSHSWFFTLHMKVGVQQRCQHHNLTKLLQQVAAIWKLYGCPHICDKQLSCNTAFMRQVPASCVHGNHFNRTP